MITFGNLESWSKMPTNQRLNLLIGAIIVCLAAVIVYYEAYKIPQINEVHNNNINRNNDRHSMREINLQTKLDLCNQHLIKVIQENKKDFEKLFYTTQNLRTKYKELTHENDI